MLILTIYFIKKLNYEKIKFDFFIKEIVRFNIKIKCNKYLEVKRVQFLGKLLHTNITNKLVR
jgi:hypothetical protein